MKNVIALTGPKGCGKSTLASHLLLSPFIPQKVEIMSFAEPIKKMGDVIMPKNARLADNKENPRCGVSGKSPRYIYQTLGKEWGRELIGANIWVDVMRHNIEESDACTIIIDDLRFQNEAELVCELGGKIYLVDRAGVSYTGEHESEQRLNWPMDGVIPNRSFCELEAIIKTWNPLA